jgi:transposase
MLFVSEITEAEIITLQLMGRYHPLAWTRIRANAILLSNECITIQLIAEIHGVCRQTVSTWLHAWESNGLCGLIDESRSGRTPIISNKIDEENIIKMVEDSPRSLKRVLDEIENIFGIEIAISTLKRICKKFKLSWKRVRKSLKNKRDPERFKKSIEMIEGLIAQEANGDIDLYFFDESGFTLEPCVPYAWQYVNETIELPSSKSKRLNVLGFVNRDCQFESYVFEGSVNTSVVVACFDEFAKIIKKETTVIIDNAPTHTSKEFIENIEKWKKQGLNIEPIAPYSPELNIIEILWRKIKYEWLPFSAYNSYDTLKSSLFDVLKNIGKNNNYNIQFA